MAKDIKRGLPPERDDGTPVVGGDDNPTTQGGGGYWSGQGVDPQGDTASTDEAGTGSAE